MGDTKHEFDGIGPDLVGSDDLLGPTPLMGQAA